MKIEVTKNMRQRTVVEGDLLVIRDSCGNPVVVVADMGEGQLLAEVASPENADVFNALISKLGLGPPLVIGGISQRPLADIQV